MKHGDERNRRIWGSTLPLERLYLDTHSGAYPRPLGYAPSLVCVYRGYDELQRELAELKKNGGLLVERSPELTPQIILDDSDWWMDESKKTFLMNDGQLLGTETVRIVGGEVSPVRIYITETNPEGEIVYSSSPLHDIDTYLGLCKREQEAYGRLTLLHRERRLDGRSDLSDVETSVLVQVDKLRKIRIALRKFSISKEEARAVRHVVWGMEF